MIKYAKMSLFEAPEGSLLVHACNLQGVWGSGIAKEFKERYPRSFKEYEMECFRHLINVGDYLVSNQENKRNVISLITSFDYGKKVDSPAAILVNTTLALNSMANDYFTDHDYPPKFYSNKFNSGMFKVPWERTEEILKVFVERYDLDWTVCEVD